MVIVDKAVISKVESIACGVFGAVIGGQLQVTLLAGPPTEGFSPATLIGALGGGIAMLLTLSAFRKAIGPLKPKKKKRQAR